MKKTFIIFPFVLSSLLLCACGGAAVEPLNAGVSVPDMNIAEIAMPYDTSVYFDTSDLTYVGTTTQQIAIGYSFENPEDQDPVLTYRQYESEDGEVFSFDMQGRLCYYRNSEDIFENQITADDTVKLIDSEKQDLVNSVYQSCVDAPDAAYTITAGGKAGEYQIVSQDSTLSPTCAILKMNEYGDIRSFKISHNTLASSVDTAYFEKKIQAYIAEKEQQYDDLTCEYTVRYEQIDNKIYALYNCHFLENGAAFCELVGFTKSVSQNDHEVS